MCGSLVPPQVTRCLAHALAMSNAIAEDKRLCVAGGEEDGRKGDGGTESKSDAADDTAAADAVAADTTCREGGLG